MLTGQNLRRRDLSRSTPRHPEARNFKSDPAGDLPPTSATETRTAYNRLLDSVDAPGAADVMDNLGR